VVYINLFQYVSNYTPSLGKGDGLSDPRSISPSNLNFSIAEDQTLELIMGAIIPESSIPGAISLGVPVFVKTMLKDCYETKAQQSFKNVMGEIPKLFLNDNKKELSAATESEKEQFIFSLEKGKHGEEAQKTLASLKGLTIQGYMSTEYIMVNHLNYQMAPGFFNGCAPIKK
jgi:Gluconate 2-dehydrogenase subunit 3